MQQQLEQLPLIKKPLEIIGEHVNVPGAFWQGRMSTAEKETLYKCVVGDHSALHKFIALHTTTTGSHGRATPPSSHRTVPCGPRWRNGEGGGGRGCGALA